VTEIRIRQSGRRGTGVVIALIMLAVLVFAWGGPRWARIADEVEREEQQRAHLAKILDGSSHLLKMRPALEKSSKQAVDNLPQRREPSAAEEADPTQR
jgi:hypothetical protein